MVFVAPEMTGDRTRIIDGQQRLATIVLILCALKHVLHIQDTPRAKERINKINSWIYSADNVTLNKNIRLELNHDDKDFLKSIIIEDIVDEPQHPSHDLIKKAFEYFVDELNKKIIESGEVFIENFLQTLLRKLLCVKIEVDDYDDAFELFETLNDKGLELSVADLVKNHLLSLPSENPKDIEKLWEDITEQVEKYTVTRFLRHFWSSKHDLIRKEELYKAIKKTVGRENLEKSMQELNKEAEVYRNLREPDHEFWNYEPIEKALEEINLLGVDQIYVILLAVYNKFYTDEKEKFIKILNALLNLSFRYNTICQYNPNKLENVYSELAIGIRKGTMTFDQIYDKIKKLEPDENKFKEAFNNFQTKKAKLAKYILTRVNDDMMKESGKGEITTNKETTNLEHIIPKKPNTEWKTFFQDKHIDDYTTLNHKIGNMTILLGRWNSTLKNKFFDKKVVEYKKSTLPINEDLKGFTEFGAVEIAERQNKIGIRAENLWKIR